MAFAVPLFEASAVYPRAGSSAYDGQHITLVFELTTLVGPGVQFGGHIAGETCRASCGGKQLAERAFISMVLPTYVLTCHPAD